MEFYNGTNIKMRRGDSDSIEVTGLSLAHGDKLYFTVKNSVYSTDKKVAKGHNRLHSIR